jgi:capsular exopolysaccharide synthesis family protein
MKSADMIVASRMGGNMQFAAPPGLSPDARTVDLKKTLSALWRRKVLFITVAAVLFGIGAYYVMSLKTLYSADTVVVLSTRTMRIFNSDTVMSSSNDDNSVATEVQMIMSQKVALAVIEKLNLTDQPEFQKRNAPNIGNRLAQLLQEGLTEIATRLPSSIAVALVGERPAVPIAVTSGPNVEPVDPEQAILAAFSTRLAVTPIPRSRAINISFTASDPKLAAEVVNAVAVQYLTMQVETKSAATRAASRWLASQLSEVRDKADQAGLAVEEFRNNSGLTRGNGGTLAGEEVSQINGQLAVAKVALSEALARQANARNETSPGSALPEALGSPLISSLRQQEAAQQRVVATLARDHGELFPTLGQARTDLADIRSKISLEINRLRQGLDADVDRRRTQVESLQSRLDELKQRAVQLGQAEVKLRTLERDAETSDTQYRNFLQRYKETSLEESIQQPDAVIVTTAQEPTVPSYPNRRVLLALSLFVSCGVSAGLVILLSFNGRGIRTPEALEAQFGQWPIGQIPLVRANKSGGIAQKMVSGGVRSQYADSIHRLNMRLAASSGRSESVLITSSVPGEGKSTTALALAVIAAAAGRKVVLVDCDMRKPSLHKILGLNGETGLGDVLQGRVRLEEAIIHHGPTGVDLIPAGQAAGHPINVFAQGQLNQILQTLKQDYHQVIIDCAPTLAVADALYLANVVDKVVYVVQWGSTDHRVVQSGMRTVMEGGGVLAGMVLSKVDFRRVDTSPFADARHRDIEKYYG